MSDFDLTVGKAYSERRNRLCLSHLHSLGLVEKGLFGGYKGNGAEWAGEDREVTSICLLNLATVCVFTDFVAQLLAQPKDKLMRDEVFGHLPWWMDSLWVPVAFSKHRSFEKDPEGPFFLGSVPRLREALQEIKRRSPLPLEPTPPGYNVMRNDPQAFALTFNSLSGNDDCIRWVWKGLQDAATVAQKEWLPMLGCGL